MLEVLQINFKSDTVSTGFQTVGKLKYFTIIVDYTQAEYTRSRFGRLSQFEINTDPFKITEVYIFHEMKLCKFAQSWIVLQIERTVRSHGNRTAFADLEVPIFPIFK
ncbi:MAG: hypothetical protein J6C40_04960 [Lentisphaeria bacterium]|nr:hypothetical protein [Lentisphaeria bacterium]